MGEEEEEKKKKTKPVYIEIRKKKVLIMKEEHKTPSVPSKARNRPQPCLVTSGPTGAKIGT